MNKKYNLFNDPSNTISFVRFKKDMKINGSQIRENLTELELEHFHLDHDEETEKPTHNPKKMSVKGLYEVYGIYDFSKEDYQNLLK